MKNMQFDKRGLAIFLSLWMGLSSTPLVAGSIDQHRPDLANHGMYFGISPEVFNELSIYQQIVPMTTGKTINKGVEHATYQYGELTMYSQDPQYAVVNGIPFLEYVSRTHDVRDDGPMFSMNSEMVLCWIDDESTLMRGEEYRFAQFMEGKSMDFDNHCIDNQSIPDYWEGVSRDIEIR